MRANKRAFSGITEAGAQILARILPSAQEAGGVAYTFQGAWVDRRLVIIGGRIEREFGVHTTNPLALTVTVPVTASAKDLMSALRSFGGAAERIWRDSKKGTFDAVVSADDFDRHQVHRYHHVALCGHKPKERWLSEDEVAPIAEQVQACPKCTVAAATKPVHRARWHPSATKANDAGGSAA